MSRNGSGTYNLPAGNPVVTATTITSTWANTTLSDIATALTGSLAADGQTPASGNLNMNTNQIKNVVDPTLAQDAATKAYVDAGSAAYLLKASNLSDVANATTARGNLSAAKSGANSDITSIAGLTTPLTVAQGGIGAGTLTANNVLLGNGTSAPQVVAPSTAGNVLTSNGTTWVSSAISASGVTSAVAGNGVAVSGATGAVTFSAAAPTAGSVGSYALLGSTNTTAVSAGGTKAGSSLRYIGLSQSPLDWTNSGGINSVGTTTAPSGTWQAMGRDSSQFDACGSTYGATLWVRTV